MAHFFPVETKRTPNQKDVHCARRLKVIVIKTKSRRQTISIMKWADEFRILRKELLADADDRIERALSWLEEHATDDDAPPINSGQAFRKLFDWLEEKVKKTIPKVRISDEAKAIARRLRMLNWPKGSDSQLEKIIQLSLDNHRRIVKQIKQVPTRDTSYQSFIQRAVLPKLGESSAFVENWMRMIHRNVKDWDDFKGQLLPFALTLDSARLDRMGRDWAIRYGVSELYWESLIKDARACK